MIYDLMSAYFGAMAEFWGVSLRLGLPHLVLLVLILIWVRRGRGPGICCGKAAVWPGGGRWCCRRRRCSWPDCCAREAGARNRNAPDDGDGAASACCMDEAAEEAADPADGVDR